MTKRLKQLLIACHPDKHGGDHSRMEDFFAVANKSRAGLVKQPHRCQYPGCGVAVTPHSRACGAHWRSLRRMAITAAFVLVVGLINAQPSVPLPIAKAAAYAPTNPPGVTLAWDVSPDPSVVGYKIHIGGESRVYTNSAAVGGATTVALGLEAGRTYYFAATAYDAAGADSVYSNEVIYRVPFGRRVERLVVEIYETVGGPKAGEFEWLTYTNTLTGSPQKFLRVRQELIRIE